MSAKNDSLLKFPHVCVVEASAGSGKTYALAKRYIQLLMSASIHLHDTSLRKVLAITFTNKATVEMKSRIIEFLKKIAFDNFNTAAEKKDILGALGVSQEEAQKKAHDILEEIIRRYSFFQVQTIDSFINALLLGCALRIGRSANFAIKTDYRRQLLYCFDTLVDRASTDKEIFDFLQEFLKHYLFVENRKSWFPRQDILALMQVLLRMANSYGKLFDEYQVKSEDVIIQKKLLFLQMKELMPFPEGMNGKAKTAIEKFIAGVSDVFDVKDLPDYFQRVSVPLNKDKECLPSYESHWKKISQGIRKLVEQETEVVYTPYVKLFRHILDLFQQRAQKDDVLFLEELNHKARLLFDQEGVTVAELYYRLAARFKHYLIDEFQDTSILQWMNIELMIEDALASGGSLFYVGDKKQAIYRFRGGEAQLFDAVQRKFRHFNIGVEHLEKNWRSQKAIVDFNNGVFSRENLLQGLLLSGITDEISAQAVDEVVAVFKGSSQVHKEENDKGYVCSEYIDEKNKEELYEIMRGKLIALVKDLKLRFSDDEITILARDNEEIEVITGWLFEAGFRVESDKTLNVLEHTLVKELVAFLRFLHSPVDDLSFAAFITGELFCSASGFSVQEMETFLFHLHKEEKLTEEGNLYVLFRQYYPKVWDELISEFFKSVGFISSYEMIVNVYQRFAVLEKFKDSQAFLMKFLELIKNNEEESSGIGDLLEYFRDPHPEDIYVNVLSADALRVLTIHKSKGLEFGVVIIPFLRMDISPEKGAKGLKAYIEAQARGGLGLLRIIKEYLPYSERLQTVFSCAYKEACIDELNAIYVALTRPKYELYVFIPQKSGNSKNKMRSFIPEQKKELGAQGVYTKTKEKAGYTLMDSAVGLDNTWFEKLKDEFTDRGMCARRQDVVRGNIIHALLSCIPDCDSKNRKDLIREALKKIQLQFPFIMDVSFYQQKIDQILDCSDFKSFFFVVDAEVFCEKEMIDRFGDTKRIDRLIVRDGEIWVIDYKPKHDETSAYHRQVQEYMRIAGDVYKSKKIRGFILYWDEIGVEEIAPRNFEY